MWSRGRIGVSERHRRPNGRDPESRLAIRKRSTCSSLKRTHSARSRSVCKTSPSGEPCCASRRSSSQARARRRTRGAGDSEGRCAPNSERDCQDTRFVTLSDLATHVTRPGRRYKTMMQVLRNAVDSSESESKPARAGMIRKMPNQPRDGLVFVTLRSDTQGERVCDSSL